MKSYDQPRQHIKKQRYYFSNKGSSSQSSGFSSRHVRMWELHYKENWTLKNWCFWTVVLEKILESPLDCEEIQPVHPKGNQSWIFTGSTDVGAEIPILWPPNAKNWLIWKRPWCWERVKAGGKRRRQGMRWLDGIADSMDISLSKQRIRHNWATELNWAEFHMLMSERIWLSSVAQSCLTLWPHRLQHNRLPCPSPTPGAYSNSCPLNRWCHPTISSSVIPFSSCLQSFPASGSFQMSQFFTSGGQRIVVSISGSVGGLFQLFLGRGGDFQVLGHHPLLELLTVPWNCHGTSGCVISLADWGSRSSLVCHLCPTWF